MKLLVDTHVFLWLLLDEPQLPADVRAAVADPGNEVFLSVASVWEAVIKQSIGKLRLPAPATEYLPRNRERLGIASLPVDEGAMPHLAALPLLHKDPFDRILVAQTQQHGLTLATADDEVRHYPVPVLPAR